MKVCFSASIPTDTPTGTTPTAAKRDQDSEEFKQMMREVEKNLNDEEKLQFNEAIFNITNAESIEQGIAGAVIFKSI